ncbi:MAG: N-acyl homoserine lactonase family protein [bacterium]
MKTLVFPAILLSNIVFLSGCSNWDTINNNQPVSEESEQISALNDSKTNQKPLVELYTLDCGKIEISDLDAFSTAGDYAGQTDTFGDGCFLIKHPQGYLLWDLGLPANLVQSGPQTQQIFTVSLQRRLVDQLKDIQLQPSDIDYVAISHSHFDHTGQAEFFADNHWLVNAKEYDFMFGNEESATKNAAFSTMPTTKISGDYDVFGDGSVVIFETLGHTPGHTSLEITLQDGRVVMLSGDLYHRQQSRDLRRVPRFNYDEAQTMASFDIFEKRAKEKNARVILQHVQSDLDALPQFPDSLH